MRSLSVLLGMGLVLAGCATDPAQRAARESAHLRELARVCEKVGYAAGTEANKDCVVKLLAAEISQPRVVEYPFRPGPTFCNAVGRHIVCNSF